MSTNNKQIRGLLLKVDNVVICEVVEVDAEPGEPNCRIVNPYEFVDGKLVPWPEVSGQNELMIRSSDILTVVEPKEEIINQYLELTA